MISSHWVYIDRSLAVCCSYENLESEGNRDDDEIFVNEFTSFMTVLLPSELRVSGSSTRR